MVRIIVRTDDAGMAASVGGAVLSTYRTFDVEIPDVEEFIRKDGGKGAYTQLQIVGVELLPLPPVDF